jgi:hypothetical protein
MPFGKNIKTRPAPLRVNCKRIVSQTAYLQVLIYFLFNQCSADDSDVTPQEGAAFTFSRLSWYTLQLHQILLLHRELFSLDLVAILHL